jgi:hypothetical protein
MATGIGASAEGITGPSTCFSLQEKNTARIADRNRNLIFI